jgi:hypothetical protein
MTTTSISRPFLLDGRPVTMWEADEWATQRGLHIEIVWPEACIIADRWHDAATRTPAYRQLSGVERSRVLALLETGHAAAEVATLYGVPADTIRNIDAARIKRRQATRRAA